MERRWRQIERRAIKGGQGTRGSERRKRGAERKEQRVEDEKGQETSADRKNWKELEGDGERGRERG